MLAEGIEVPEVAKALEVSEATYHRWRAQFGGMKADDVKRLKEFERENQTLKRIVANKEVEIEGLKEIAKGRMKVKLASVRSSFLVGCGASRRRCARRLSAPGASFGVRVRGGVRG
jgi:putative transposase